MPVVDNTPFVAKDNNLRQVKELSMDPMVRADGVDPRTIPGSGWDKPQQTPEERTNDATVAAGKRHDNALKNQMEVASKYLLDHDTVWVNARLDALAYHDRQLWLHVERQGLNRPEIFHKFGEPQSTMVLPKETK